MIKFGIFMHLQYFKTFLTEYFIILIFIVITKMSTTSRLLSLCTCTGCLFYFQILFLKLKHGTHLTFALIFPNKTPSLRHEHMEHPGTFNERPTANTSSSDSNRDYSERAFTVGLGGPVGSGTHNKQCYCFIHS